MKRYLFLLVTWFVDAADGADFASAQHSDGEAAHGQSHHADDHLPRVAGTETPVRPEVTA